MNKKCTSFYYKISHFSKNKIRVNKGKSRVKVVLRRLAGMEMIVFDLDGVLVNIESSWQAVHKAFGVDNEENFRKCVHSQIDFKEFMRSDIRLWNGPNISRIKQILEEAPLMKGAQETISTLQKAGYKTAIISSGISVLADRIKNELKIDYCFSNKLLTDDSGLLTGEGEEVVNLFNKDKVLRDLTSTAEVRVEQCVVIGDSRFDISLFNGAGLSIAFNAKEKSTRDAADLSICEKDLTLILPWLVNEDETALAEIVFNYDDENEAEAIVKAVEPDNKSSPPGLIVKTTRKRRSVYTRVFSTKGVETLLATLDDLFSCIKVAENVLETG
ncbi:MAG: phosphoserine phosphatase [Thermoproteota archaeon]|nr:phosphoserine phosphatase [Thermoproteota archaeon]